MTDASAAKSTIYICYFSLREPLVQTQVVPYLQEVAKAGTRVSLLTFEPRLKPTWPANDIGAADASLREKGIQWSRLPYHKRPTALATAWDILCGVVFLRRKIANDDVDILHGRVHVATLMGALARRLSKRKPKLVFDIRGFFPEEYTDAGVWPEGGWLFRAAKRVERWLLKESDGFVVLTENARHTLFPGSGDPPFKNDGRPVEVIPCCVDFETRFDADHLASRNDIRAKLAIGDRFVFTHLGALGGLYLTKEIVDFLGTARRLDPNIYAMFLTQTDGSEAIAFLKNCGFIDADYFVGKVDPSEVPSYLAASDVGLSFVKATYATRSRSPTKIPEYLAAGLPIIANSGVGDVDELITSEGVGVLLRSFDDDEYVKAINQVHSLEDIGARCREVAHRRFDLETVGGFRYRRLYDRLFCDRDD
jgi:glycosyltransferase involved in cell wall biosynthesis